MFSYYVPLIGINMPNFSYDRETQIWLQACNFLFLIESKWNLTQMEKKFKTKYTELNGKLFLFVEVGDNQKYFWSAIIWIYLTFLKDFNFFFIF